MQARRDTDSWGGYDARRSEDDKGVKDEDEHEPNNKADK